MYYRTRRRGGREGGRSRTVCVVVRHLIREAEVIPTIPGYRIVRAYRFFGSHAITGILRTYPGWLTERGPK